MASDIGNASIILLSVGSDPSLDIHHIIEPLLQQIVRGSFGHHSHLARHEHCLALFYCTLQCTVVEADQLLIGDVCGVREMDDIELSTRSDINVDVIG